MGGDGQEQEGPATQNEREKTAGQHHGRDDAEHPRFADFSGGAVSLGGQPVTHDQTSFGAMVLSAWSGPARIITSVASSLKPSEGCAVTSALRFMSSTWIESDTFFEKSAIVIPSRCSPASISTTNSPLPRVM